jgi:vacuolar-type H+-ATPase subunit I/STV1
VIKPFAEDDSRHHHHAGGAMKSAMERFGPWVIPIIITIIVIVFNAGGDRQMAVATAKAAQEEARAVRSEMDLKYARRDQVDALKEMFSQRLDQSDKKLDEAKEELRRLRTTIEMQGRGR